MPSLVIICAQTEALLNVVQQLSSRLNILHSNRSSVHEMQADHRQKTQVLEHKGCGDASRIFTGKCSFFSAEECGDFCWKCGTNAPPLENGGMYGKTRTNETCCFRAKNSETRCGRRRRTGGSDRNRRSFSRLAKPRFAEAITRKQRLSSRRAWRPRSRIWRSKRKDFKRSRKRRSP